MCLYLRLDKMNEIETIIDSVESQWLDELHSYSERCFSTVNVPSHDHLHHLRVWQLAKALVIELSSSGHTFTKNEIQNLIIAVFFHDLGMINTIDTKHGHESKMLCEQYFSKCDRISNVDQEIISNAVEHHDDKDYKNMVYTGTAQKDLFSILCVCDDLDAFGAIGVFRYIEIYTLRKIPVDRLAALLIKNVESRYHNFRKLYGHLKHFHAHQAKRFNFIHSFFKKLNDQLTHGNHINITTGAIGVFNHFINDLINGTKTIEDITQHVYNVNNDHDVINFFKTFEKELE